MQRSAGLFFLLFIFYFSSSAQSNKFFKRKSIDEVTKMPIANCSVFINSTSKGTVTNDKGEFILQNLPEGNHELIISSIGYQTFAYDYKSADLPLDVRVSLKQKMTELSKITVEPEVKDGWKVWGKTFLNNFIGTTENAKDCSIKNTDALHFRFSQKTNRLSVIADEPLIIENKALGYSIKYQLEEFYVDFHTRISFYLGYPFFSEMITGRKKKQNEWEKKRQEAYFGSMIHFMKSLYYAQSKKQGFELIRKVKTLNAKKKMVRDMYVAYQAADSFQVQKNGTLKRVGHDHILSEDSVEYYNAILSKPDYYDEYLQISPDSLITANDDETKSIFFTDTLYVIYTSPKDRSRQQSIIYLMTPASITIYNNGIYFPPQEVVTNGYWGRFGKVANELPLDYEEIEKKK